MRDLSETRVYTTTCGPQGTYLWGRVPTRLAPCVRHTNLGHTLLVPNPSVHHPGLCSTPGAPLFSMPTSIKPPRGCTSPQPSPFFYTYLMERVKRTLYTSCHSAAPSLFVCIAVNKRLCNLVTPISVAKFLACLHMPVCFPVVSKHKR